MTIKLGQNAQILQGFEKSSEEPQLRYEYCSFLPSKEDEVKISNHRGVRSNEYHEGVLTLPFV